MPRIGLDDDQSAAGVAYFSMEIALEPQLPTYSGGLGILAGDALRAAADTGLPMVGVTLVHRKGYFRQHLDASGQQSEEPQVWSPEDHLETLAEQASLMLEGRRLRLRAWRYLIRGTRGHAVPVYLLDTELPDNDAWDRSLTDHLYGGDDRYRLAQELVLGVGGVPSQPRRPTVEGPLQPDQAAGNPRPGYLDRHVEVIVWHRHSDQKSSSMPPAIPAV